ncbi:thioredoxin-dependent thiol peroxidase [Pelagibacterium montanilacus]|uniref:thioredoxin-dependent thiol peroxidase n=1 Tax=Pelagibacterium montanilacus TaxID=2185280 RepID=UPI000F8F294F|nr:thioredoxin-dependent thiol peroxidase [Pelagibacterium montanilacus]
MSKLQPGDVAPGIELPTDTSEVFRLSDHADHSVLLYFYPQADTPACTDQNLGFTAQADAFAAHGVVLVGISPDTPETLAKFRQKHDLSPILVADPDHVAMEAYGVWGEKKNYGRTYVGLIRSSFLVGPGGKIERVWFNTRAKGHVDRVLKELG